MPNPAQVLTPKNSDSTPCAVEIRHLLANEDATAFQRLNEEWITRHFVLEPKDIETLSDPENAIFRKGGRILMAYAGAAPVGCVALVPMSDGAVELAKMAVTPNYRGRGIGRRLLEYAIEAARSMGVNSIFLGSSTKLPAAVHLYESVGFRHVPRDSSLPMPYTRADVFMQLALAPSLPVTAGVSTCQVRRATGGDLIGVMQLVRRVVPLMRASGNFQWDDEYPDNFVFEQDVQNGLLWVAEVDRMIAGIAAITTDQSPEYAEVGWDIAETAIVVHRLAVDPAFRGKGVAMALMHQAEIVAKEQRIAVVRVDTNSQNEATQKLFPKLGYVYAGEISLGFRPGLRFLCYEKREVVLHSSAPLRLALRAN